MPRVMSMRFGWQSLPSLAIWPPANLAMRDYFIRRFLLLFPTLLVISIIVFGITRLAPGGPVEKLMQEMKTMDLGGDSSAAMGQEALSEEARQLELIVSIAPELEIVATGFPSKCSSSLSRVPKKSLEKELLQSGRRRCET